MRDSAISKTTAKHLYAGQQMKLILEGIENLRKIALVDHFIISAGFGLISEEELIPSYDVTFSGLSKSEIMKRSAELNISKNFSQLNSNYDLVYLALGKDYLQSLGDIKTTNYNEVVIFNDDKGESNVICPDLSHLIGVKDEKLIPYGIGATINAKGGLFKNFSNWFLCHNKELVKETFKNYWLLISKQYNI